jgi:hypothetical protein
VALTSNADIAPKRLKFSPCISSPSWRSRHAASRSGEASAQALEAGMEGGGGGGGEEVEEELASIDIDPRMQRQLDLELVGEG